MDKGRKWALFIYCIFLIWFCVLSRKYVPHQIAYPGWSFCAMLEYRWDGFLLYQTLGNIILYMPIGFILSKKCISLWNTMSYGLLICSIIEVLQFVFYRGILDFDDIINNVVGAIIGKLTADCVAYKK